MLSFFKKKSNDTNKLKNDGLESTVPSSKLIDNEMPESTEEVETPLSIHPAATISQEQMYVLRFLNNELPLLKANQLSLSGIEWEEQPEGLAVSAFVRNSVDKELQLGEVRLLLINEQEQVKAKHVFNMKELGSLPATSSRPWTFLFPKETVIPSVPLEKENWTLAFDLTSTKHELDLAPAWEEALPEQQKEQLRKIVAELGTPNKDELNFTGLQAHFSEEGQFHVTLLIRNGYEKNLKIEQLPLQVLDQQKEVIAEGQFHFEDFEVKANTTKPWTVIFHKELVTKEQPDLTTWSVRVKG
ncbi:accessory Sec system S-layer assembly protein [Bacillus sp. REN10]|uniref:accessory Sec system S-layer assembly protein n=1 Tax=Bacillus sp. REN10 TaxID=2782541 RepID=UPI00193BA0B8|nr:accessory Sec system S-layer assembly protein [Bacillus sp. REN10]